MAESSSYEKVTGTNLIQGDVLEKFPVYVPIIDGYSLKYDIKIYNTIVLTQSCDLAHDGKCESVILCGIEDLEAFKKSFFKPADNTETRTNRLNRIREGLVPSHHMLAECKLRDFERPIRIVDFRVIYSMPIKYVEQFAGSAGERIRLCSPSREHLSQAFARYFMRVGLPNDQEIPKFK